MIVIKNKKHPTQIQAIALADNFPSFLLEDDFDLEEGDFVVLLLEIVGAKVDPRRKVVGRCEGAIVGISVGEGVVDGVAVGEREGCFVGFVVGKIDGCFEGRIVFVRVG